MEPNAVDPNVVPAYLQIAVAWATVFGVVGVVVAGIGLWVQWLRGGEERMERAAQAILERERFEKQIDALQQAENDRLAAQARRIVPTLIKASSVIPNLWHVRIDNASAEVISGLQIDVHAVNAENEMVAGGCAPADRTSVGAAMAEFFVQTITPTFDVMIERYQHFIEQVRIGAIQLGEDPAQMEAYVDQIAAGLHIDENTAAAMKDQVKHVVAIQLTDQWPTFLSPGQFAAMAFMLTSDEFVPRVHMRFEDSAGYTWERTDITKPKRISEPVTSPKSVEIQDG